MPSQLEGISIGVCVGTVVLVWVIGALYSLSHSPGERIRGQVRPTPLVGVAVLCAALGILSRGYFHNLVVDSTWARYLGLVLLIISTIFTLWARFSLGTMWSIGPQVGGNRRLRTHGPYAVTRHPIYTGILGMMLGFTLISGVGQWIVLFPVGLILFEVKIRMEESLMMATFTDEYRRYRQQVPQLVPGLKLRRHQPVSS